MLAEAALQRYRHPPTWRSPRAYRRLQTTCGEFKGDSPTQAGVGAAAGSVRPRRPLGGVGTCGSRPLTPVWAPSALQQRPLGLHATFLVVFCIFDIGRPSVCQQLWNLQYELVL